MAGIIGAGGVSQVSIYGGGFSGPSLGIGEFSPPWMEPVDMEDSLQRTKHPGVPRLPGLGTHQASRA